MKVVEYVSVDGEEPSPVVWGSNMSPVSAMIALGQAIEHQQARDAGEVHTFQGRIKTTSIVIEF